MQELEEYQIEVPEFLIDRQKFKHYSEEEKRIVCNIALDAMANGLSMFEVTRELGLSAAGVLSWIGEDVEMEKAYERLKPLRARVLFEKSLNVINTETDYRMINAKARNYMTAAGLLNPKEFSDKMHHNLMKGGGGSGPVQISMHFGSGEQNKGELVAITQPDSGDST